jgi:hypothetical protein
VEIIGGYEYIRHIVLESRTCMRTAITVHPGDNVVTIPIFFPSTFIVSSSMSSNSSSSSFRPTSTASTAPPSFNAFGPMDISGTNSVRTTSNIVPDDEQVPPPPQPPPPSIIVE